jgi:hypothetical protein
MGVKKSTRAKTATGKATAKRLREKAEGLKAKMAPTRALGAGLAFAGVVVVAGVVMFAGRDSGERAEAAAVAAQVDSPAVQAAKPVRAIAGVPKKSTPKAGPADAPRSPGAPKTASELPDAVSLEGCLEQSGETFRLKDTAGEDAPKSRSWKSGFLKKGSKPVEVVDWNNRLKSHVGERVSVSGMFVDGEMHVRSLRRVAATCN